MHRGTEPDLPFLSTPTPLPTRRTVAPGSDTRHSLRTLTPRVLPAAAPLRGQGCNPFLSTHMQGWGWGGTRNQQCFWGRRVAWWWEPWLRWGARPVPLLYLLGQRFLAAGQGSLPSMWGQDSLASSPGWKHPHGAGAPYAPGTPVRSSRFLSTRDLCCMVLLPGAPASSPPPTPIWALL